MSWVDPGSGFRNVKDVLFGEYLKVMTCLMAFPAIQVFRFLPAPAWHKRAV
jgi:hypothetical protein